MALIEHGECRIEKLNSSALGIARTEEGIVELAYTLPGELVEFERHSYRGKENFILKKIIEPSAIRKEPPCRYYERCGGCSLQHLSTSDYKDFKSKIITEAIAIANLKPEIVSLENPLRRRLNLVFSKNEKQLYFGFYQLKSDKIVNIDLCIVANQDLSLILLPIRTLLENILKTHDSGEIFLLKSDNGIDIKIITKSQHNFEENTRRKLKSLLNKYGLIRIIYIHNKQLVFTVKHEQPYIEFANLKVSIEADCFLQATKESDQVIANIILDYLGADTTKKIAELFCGRGTLTIPMLKAGYSVFGYENDKDALIALKNVTKEYKSNFQFRDLYYSPLNNELANVEIIVLNPPRAGAEEQIKQFLKFNNLQKIIYISCSIESFTRDIKILKNKYKLNRIVGIDQFLWSPHIEIIAEFIKDTAS